MRHSLIRNALLAVAVFAALPAAAATDDALDLDFAGVGYRRVAFDAGGANGDLLTGLAREPSGNYVLAGYVESPTSPTGFKVGVARISRSSGAILSTFTHDPFFSTVENLAVDTLGRQIVVGLTPTNADTRPDLGVVRYLAGAPDTSFAGDGGLSFDSPISANTTDAPLDVAVRGNGEIIVLIAEVSTPNTTPNPYTLVRIPQNGVGATALSLGPTTLGYGGGAMLLQPDGKILVVVNVLINGGYCLRPRLLRFAPDTLTDLDVGFGSSGITTLAAPTETGNCAPTVNTIALDAQGRILMNARKVDTGAQNWAVRLTPNGVPDSSFNGDGWSPVTLALDGEHTVQGIAAQRDGSVILGGQFTSSTPGVGPRSILTRLLPNGANDTRFGTQGSSLYVPGNSAREQGGTALLMEGDKAVLAGYWSAGASDYDFQVLRTAGPLLRNGFE